MEINYISINNNRINDVVSSAKKKEKKEQKAEKIGSIKESDLNKMMFKKDIIITLDLDKLLTNIEQCRLVAKFHTIDDDNFSVNNVQLFKKKGNSIMEYPYQLGIDFRKVFYAKETYFDYNMIQYIAGCKSYAIKAFEYVFDQVFNPVRVEQIMNDILCDVEYSMNVLVINMDFYPIAHYCMGFEIDNFVNKDTYNDRINQLILDMKRSSPIDLETPEIGALYYTDCFAYGIRGGHVLFNRDVAALKDFEYFKYLESDKIVDYMRKFFDARDIDMKGMEEHNSNLLMDKMLKRYGVNILSKLAGKVMLSNLDKTLYDFIVYKMKGTPMIHHVYYTMR